MAGIYLGGTAISDIRLGSTQVNEIRLGSTLIWSRAGAGAVKRDDFDRDDAATLGAGWVDFGPDNDWVLGISNGTARVQIPDGLVGGAPDFRTSQMQWAGSPASGDDGRVEVAFTSRGDDYSITQNSNFKTQVFGRMSNGDWTHGVGIQAIAGRASLVKKVSGLDTVVTDTHLWQPGQPITHTFVGDLHKLFIGGEQVDAWNDSSSTASKGIGFRQFGIRGDGGKDWLGPRRFSPAIDYALMS